MSEQTKVISRVEDGQQAIVICLFAKNSGGAAILDSQLDLAINMAKNVLQLGGARSSGGDKARRRKRSDAPRRCEHNIRATRRGEALKSAVTRLSE